MRIVITGGTGFIGAELARTLLGQGHEVVVLSRSVQSAVVRVLGAESTAQGFSSEAWDGLDSNSLVPVLDGKDAVVNLIGESIASRRWSKAQKQRIRDSRVLAGQAVTQALKGVGSRPGVLIQGSAVGFYGDGQDRELDETAAKGQGFLAETAEAWEGSTREVEDLGVRRIVIRTGVVLGRGGALTKMLAPFRFFMGGPVGSGKQWFPWIHLHDQVRAIIWLLENNQALGPYNLTAPGIVSNREFSRALGKAMSRPSWLPVPGFALKAVMGEMARELLLMGQKALPAKLLDQGFAFSWPDVGPALTDILG
ncbi:MAG: TIGR01777 family protein [Desulfovibrio sp.]|nr:MAG: TIGR01777 family protein [Desulfovibrio sp.]